METYFVVKGWNRKRGLYDIIGMAASEYSRQRLVELAGTVPHYSTSHMLMISEQHEVSAHAQRYWLLVVVEGTEEFVKEIFADHQTIRITPQVAADALEAYQAQYPRAKAYLRSFCP